ncbi:MAG TPA: ASKHA domain-containing protein [Dehalococcoidales bacterium]|nr:MAG: ferredoxin [Chloroflexi bacterium RBG_16_60_22]HJX12905.1 ASKHA domain-containing protein [Dehalococcoidales bacterium]
MKTPGHTVIFQPSGARGEIKDGTTILEASRRVGADIEGLCGGKGTCGKCRVKIEEGFFPKYRVNSSVEAAETFGRTNAKFLSRTQRKNNYRMACHTRVRGDIVVFVPEESRQAQQVIRKEATRRRIRLNPAVKRYTVALAAATLQDSLGDLERLQAELGRRFKLKDLTIDYAALLDLQGTVRQGEWKVTASVWKGKEIIDVAPGELPGGYGLAVDIGTTTVAGYLCDLTTGEVVATHAIMNPQVAYGEDVMSRITYAVREKDGLKRLHGAIIKGINEVAGRAAAKAGIRRADIIDMTAVGNTCMHHIFLNIDPNYLGRTPFPPALHHSLDIKARDLGLRIAPGAYLHVLPIEAGFVGADNVGVLIAEEPYKQDEMALIIDIGTNGELILGNRQKLLSTSCATGPAFEGAEIRHGMRAAPGAIEKLWIEPGSREVRFKVIGNDRWNTEVKNIGARGICGSGIFDAAAQMFLAGIIDRSGRFNPRLKSDRLRRTDDGPEFVIARAGETSVGHDIVVCQKDIRAIQLAKGAMYSGAKIMMNRLGIEKIDRVILAGAFGSYIDKESAAVIGLFPDCDPANVIAVGNAAGDGARIALLNVAKRKEADVMARRVEYVELTIAPEFSQTFTRAMIFPHQEDKFPHLKHLLPKER